MPVLRDFLRRRIVGNMPKLVSYPYDGRIPKEDKLKREVARHLKKADHVIALTDVYTGSNDFCDAEDAKNKMARWVGNEGRFHAHAALYEFEAWLIPFWEDIQRLAGSDRGPPKNSPERINHGKPPSKLLAEVFNAGSKRKCYSKSETPRRILMNKDLGLAAAACPELKAFLNTLLTLSGGQALD